MTDPTLIADLARAGLAPELLQRVVLELARGMAEREAAERRRAKDRERKAFPPPDIPRNSGNSMEPCGSVGSVASLARAQTLTNTNLSTGEKEREVSKEERKKEARANRGSAISAEWHPSESHFLEAQEAGRDRSWVLARADDMRVWAEANSNRQVARKANWDKTFTGWMRRELRKQPNGGFHGLREDKSTTAAGRRLLAEIREQERREDAERRGEVFSLSGR